MMNTTLLTSSCLKNIFCGILLLSLCFQLKAQNQQISYQAIVRDADQNLLSNQVFPIKITLLQGAIEGAEIYSETQTVQSNKNGLITLVIGVESGWNTINWNQGPYFIKTEIGTTIPIISTTQLLSVPFAIHAQNGIDKVSLSGDTLFKANKEYLIIPGISAANFPVGEFKESDVHCNQTSAIINAVQNPITGKFWMDRNLGASRVAQSSTDQQAYGDLYQWGRRADGHQCRNSTFTISQSSLAQPNHGLFILANGNWLNENNTDLWQGINAQNNPCPNNYRVPTLSEFVTEIASWSTSNSSGAFGSVLKLPLAGSRRFNNGEIEGLGTQGRYWTSTLVNNAYAKQVYIWMSGSPNDNSYKANGRSVRCILNN